MMEQDWQLKVQSFVDGQLDEVEMREVAALVARNPEVAALVQEFKHTRQALAGYEELQPVPETREFYWSKIERQIAREPRTEAVRESPSPLAILLRWLLPVGGAVALAVAGFFLADGHGGRPSTQWQAGFAGVNALTYYDHEEGMTVMWLTYPAADTVAIEGNSGTMQ
jgi:anti-sigma factor RsiW